MNILLTNDDGILAPGINALYEELIKVGKVTVVAPDSERSSVGHGITLSHPLWHKRIEKNGRFFGTGVSGTPADCVKFATAVLLKERPDIVVSGINLGPNDGCSVFYSGTVAAAREAALIGIPSFAVSLSTFINPYFKFAAQFSAKLARNISRYKIPQGTFLNVNVPNLKKEGIKGVKVTSQCTIPIHGTFQERTSPDLRQYYWMSAKAPVNKKDLSVDTYALANDYITITPVKNDSTDYDFLKILRI
ncbi:MAG: 5'/3'-nucleotidase SurE [Candidatus Omnitrophica bacterium]|nr:5'/3'-nucleotidase SurE [Candidatus Omnitrophota bacterium]